MPRLSTLSNPTGLKDLDKKLVSVSIYDLGTEITYSLNRLDISDISFPFDTRVIVVARRGSSELRTDHGLATSWDKGFVDISELGIDGVWIFRILLVAPDSPKLLGAIENVRPDGLGSSESFIGLEPADLGNVPWEFVVLEQDGRAVIRFNQNLFTNSASAEADMHFACFVYPEAVRQLAHWHTINSGALDEPRWESFKACLGLLGVTDEPDSDDSEDIKSKWCREVVAAFCNRFRTVDKLRERLQKEVSYED